jgi:hypothetical protein
MLYLGGKYFLSPCFSPTSKGTTLAGATALSDVLKVNRSITNLTLGSKFFFAFSPKPKENYLGEAEKSQITKNWNNRSGSLNI